MTTPPSNGEIVYLTSVVMQVALEALATPPDSPNQWSATLGVVSDVGDMNLDAVQGKQGPAGQAMFALRPQSTVDDDIPNSAPVNSPEDLPTLTSMPEDVGKYWLIDEVDDQGHILSQFAYIWWGTYFRQVFMGVQGPPGPVPEVDLLVTQVAPTASAHIVTAGSALYPTWDFHIPSPQGTPGPVKALGFFPDVEGLGTVSEYGELLGFTGSYTDDGYPVFGPFNAEQYVPQTYSMPSTEFWPFSGFTQQGWCGTFADIPPQPFPWTPIVWGHIGGFGVYLSASPLMIGCQVLLGDQTSGQQVARGLGNTLGEVNIMPHYSTPGAGSNANMTPTTNRAVVPANHTGNQGTLYVNLYNDGALGDYAFSPTNAQLYVTVLPMLSGPIAAADQAAGFS